MTATVPDFNALSEAEQRAVAERLLKIEQSGWKPFWCPRSDCDGMPHPLLGPDGAEIVVGPTDTAGPHGEPVGAVYLDERTGHCRVVLDAKKLTPHDTYVHHVALDPKWAHNHARADQRLPAWLKPWILFIMSGRGTGKTRTGIEFVTLSARRGLNGAIVGRRGTELENTHVAALLEHAHPEFTPTYMASKDILVWPNGAITYLFSAERPENIRSVNLSYAWVDEAAFMDEIKTAWMNLRLATRIDDPENPIHILITSTPTSTPWVMEMEDDENVEVRRVSTYANRANLSPDFLADLEREYEGTRMGRQELHGEVLRDVEGALWNDSLFHHLRFDNPADFMRFLETMDDIVLAIDPAGSANKRSDLTGIIAVGVQHTDANSDPLPASQFFVLADGTLKGSPTEWAGQAFKVARLCRANRIVAEKNFGGDMVAQVLRDYAKLNPIETTTIDGEDYADLITVKHAAKSKETRAEGTVGKYEQGRVTHVISPIKFGDMSTLEKEQTMWVPKSRGGKSPSPNRVDALVWAVQALESKIRYAAQTAHQPTADAVLKNNPALHPTPVQPEMPAARVSVPRPEPTWETETTKEFAVKPKATTPAKAPAPRRIKAYRVK